ncbi:hypothetical protein [Embleya hyalina]|uniref:Uncharacterized protein n=1 Tax=Embleya hyalina TaxID=516124 RepID=A0A401Z3X0_9ACTN|nr:hypothetical protein [Embleya hyalina]GCE01542.1 hypothetical protein EHYA_09308 [Embleya hyalina]
MTTNKHDQDQEPAAGRRCPLGARSTHPCGGPTGDDGTPLLGWVAACGGAENSAPGCGVHLGEVLVVWDPGEWHGISGASGVPDDTAAVAVYAERVAAEVADGRRIVAVVDVDGDEDLPGPAGADELARAVRWADDAFAEAHG